MGYLNNQVVEIDAILTKKGRELLAKNPQEFKVSKFALADDEIDYRLWNPDHSLGSDYYGEVIESMPVLEGSPNETQMMKFKLVTMNKNSTYIPTISIGATNAILSSGQTYVIIPQTVNLPDGNSTLGYTAVLSDTTYAYLRVVSGYQIPSNFTRSGTTGVNVGDPGSLSVVGFRFELIAKSLTAAQTSVNSAYGTVTITGNETGGRITLNFEIQYT
jgi:hypothetical protein